MMGISGRKGCKWCGEDIHTTQYWSEMEDMRAELDALFQLGPYLGQITPARGCY